MDMMAMVSSMLAMQAAGTQQQIQTSIIKQNADAEKAAVQTLLGSYGQSRPRRRRQSQYCGLKTGPVGWAKARLRRPQSMMVGMRSLSSLCERNCVRRWARIRATRWLCPPTILLLN